MYQVEETTIKYNFKYRNHLALFRLCKFIHVNVQNFELSIAYSKSTHVFIREIITFQREFPLLESPSTSRKLIHTTLLFRFHNSQDTYASTWPAVRQIACPTKSQGFVRSKWSLRDRLHVYPSGLMHLEYQLTAYLNALIIIGKPAISTAQTCNLF